MIRRVVKPFISRIISCANEPDSDQRPAYFPYQLYFGTDTIAHTLRPLPINRLLEQQFEQVLNELFDDKELAYSIAQALNIAPVPEHLKPHVQSGEARCRLYDFNDAVQVSVPDLDIDPSTPCFTQSYANLLVGGALHAGHQGEVYHVNYIPDNRRVALKRMKIDCLNDDARAVCFREAALLRRVAHENIVAILDIFIAGGYLCTVFEFADLGDLTSLINEMRSTGLRLPESQIWEIVRSIATGLDHLHKHNIMHRDVKPSNVYISSSGEVKLGDLALGRMLASSCDKAGSMVGTPYYMSPEIINEEPYSFKTDIWSLGCLAYEITTLRVPFEGEDLFSLGQRIRNCQFAPVDGPYSLALRDFVRTVLVRQPEHRLSAHEIMQLCHSMIEQHTSPLDRALQLPVSSAYPAVNPDNPFEDIDDLGIIGRGQFSIVHKAKYKETDTLVAVKRVPSFAHMDGTDVSRAMSVVNEARLLSSLHHPNIIAYHSSHLVQGDLLLFLELAPGGDLSSVISEAQLGNQPLTEAEIWRFFAQITSGIAFMHEHRIMHRDIKPANIFLTEDEGGFVTLKIGDLGHSRSMSSRTLAAFSDVGSPFYMSPEAVNNSGYTFSSDVWSLGCLLYELAMLRSPFFERNTNLYSLGLRIKECIFEPVHSGYSFVLRELIHTILVSDPSRRPTVAEIRDVAMMACQLVDMGCTPECAIRQLPAFMDHVTEVRQIQALDPSFTMDQPFPIDPSFLIDQSFSSYMHDTHMH